MTRAGVLDRPNARSAHTRPIPKGGGVGVVAAFLAGTVALYLLADFSRIADAYFLGVIGAATAIAAVAFLDDLRDWPFTVKLGAQVLAAPVGLGWLGVPATMFWILFTTNAMNFIDGLNGLAAGVAAIAAGVLAGIAASVGFWFVYFA